ncbi:MAG: hypothetical protein ACI93T_004409, partial [Porticoccaceae bacterium]
NCGNYIPTAEQSPSTSNLNIHHVAFSVSGDASSVCLLKEVDH